MGYSQTSEPIRFERDCVAVMVPQGESVTLPAGQVGYITQALGGSFTVYVDGNLFRISGADADALGKEPPAALELARRRRRRGCREARLAAAAHLLRSGDPDQRRRARPRLQLRRSSASTTVGARSTSQMTLTAPGCGMGEILVDDVRTKLEMIPTVAEADVDLVFDPPWNHAMMSDAARLETGMF